ncbi:unnamed protein product, partial [Durusdinium trenchii]
FRQPQHRATLQWSFDASSTGSKRLFRARVGFVLDGIPHHVVGGWHPRKKLAQQDAAAGSLGFFVGEWGNHLAPPELTDVPTEALAALQVFCRSYAPCDPKISWSIERLPAMQYRALLNVPIFGVPHTFAGALSRTPDAAKADTASRFLWYLQCPNFEDRYEIDASALSREKLESPSVQWQIPGDTRHQQLRQRKEAKGEASLAETCKQIELLLEGCASSDGC